jgi:GH15 family glucan-1,4-alpha-glucosidase
MCWVALDRAVRAVEQHGLEGPVDRWRTERDAVRADVMEHGWDDELGSFTQFYGSGTLDASLLLIPLVGFLPADHPRVAGTVRAVRDTLAPDGLVLRYLTSESVGHDGLAGREGAFLACSFWLVEALAVMGEQAEAERRFLDLLDLAGPTGMLAEEYDLVEQRQVGNYPQAFSHLALVSAALTLADPARRGRAPSESETGS